MSRPKVPKSVSMTQRSPKLRHSLEIANICGFFYDQKLSQNKYGGTFSEQQLEKILEKLRGGAK